MFAQPAKKWFISFFRRSRTSKCFVFAEHQRRFAAGRNWLRLILSKYLGSPPNELQFDTQSLGKPYLIEPNNQLKFNFSRSDLYCACAVAYGSDIGIDIERIRPLSDMENTAATIFNLSDLKTWQSLPKDSQPRAFFRSWTRKEAIVKAEGSGLSLGVKIFPFQLRINLPGRKFQLY